MNPIINTVLMSVGEREFLLADVCKSSNSIGICTAANRITGTGERSSVIELFYAGEEPVISMLKTNRNDRKANKLISQIGSIADEDIKSRLSMASDNYFTFSQNLTKCLNTVLEILNEGLYVCHVAKMVPSNGGGTFFWPAYTVRHEIPGSAEVSNIIGEQNNYTPCFLVPTISPYEYSEARARAQIDKLKTNRNIGGVAYHLSGLFCALLDGHHSSVACLSSGKDFNCLVIEPIRQVLYENPDFAAEQGRSPRIIALSCPFVKIPLNAVPETMLENFLLRRYNEKPAQHEILRSKMNRGLKRGSKRSLPRDVYLKAELLPDSAMIESAHAVTDLSDGQLEALLAGETRYDDNVIISNNYYNSIVTACNYLQYADFDRFVNFAVAILDNIQLVATHKYIADRLSNTTDERIMNYFSELASAENPDPVYKEILPIAETYLRRYNDVMNERQREKDKDNRSKNYVISKNEEEMDPISLAQMESFIKRTRKQ